MMGSYHDEYGSLRQEDELPEQEDDSVNGSIWGAVADPYAIFDQDYLPIDADSGREDGSEEETLLHILKQPPHTYYKLNDGLMEVYVQIQDPKPINIHFLSVELYYAKEPNEKVLKIRPMRVKKQKHSSLLGVIICSLRVYDISRQHSNLRFRLEFRYRHGLVSSRPFTVATRRPKHSKLNRSLYQKGIYKRAVRMLSKLQWITTVCPICQQPEDSEHLSSCELGLLLHDMDRSEIR